MTPVQIYPLVQSYREAVDAAAAVRLTGGGVRALPRLVNATLAYEVINNPDWTPERDDANGWWGTLDTKSRRAALQTAIETEHDAAILGWLRVLQSSPPPADWLRSGPGVSPVVQLVDHPRPRIRYEAALWLAQAIDPDDPFAGQNRVRERLLAMKNLPIRPVALLIQANADRRLLWNRLLAAAGYGVVATPSTDQAIRIAAGDGIDLIVLARQPADGMALETIDRVRRISTAREVPLILDAPSRKPILSAEVADRFNRTEDDRVAAADPVDPDAVVFQDSIAASPTDLRRLGLSQRDLLDSDLDTDVTYRPLSPIETLAVERWDAPGSLAGMIRTFVEPAAAALDSFDLEVQRRRQTPVLTSAERFGYRQAASR